jgi:hypothetical protein
MPERVINLGGLRDAFLTRLAASYELVEVGDPRAAEATAAITTGGTGISAAQIAALPRLRTVAGFGVGYDRVDIAAARASSSRIRPASPTAAWRIMRSRCSWPSPAGSPRAIASSARAGGQAAGCLGSRVARPDAS